MFYLNFIDNEIFIETTRGILSPSSGAGGRRFKSSRPDHTKKKGWRFKPTLFYLYAERGFEAQRALTKCQKSGQGRPRQRAKGSRRRSRQDAGDVVGKSSRPDHTKKQGWRFLSRPCFICTPREDLQTLNEPHAIWPSPF